MRIFNHRYKNFQLIAWIILSLPWIQTVFPLIPDIYLGGVVKKVEFPQLSLKNWFDGSFQGQFGRWFQENIGFRGYFVRVDNQISFSLFGETVYGSNILIGKDYWLIEKGYLDSYNKRFTFDRSEISRWAEEVGRLQSLLEVRGIQFLLVFSPSKVMFAPEKIPDRFLRRQAVSHFPSKYQFTKASLDRRGVHYVDGQAFFDQRKKTSEYPLFLPSGIHWSHYGVCLFGGEVIQTLERLQNKTLGRVACHPVKVDRIPIHEDQDLTNMLNVLFRGPTYVPTAHPAAEVAFVGEARPDILEVGDSFLHTFNRFVGDKIFGKRDFFYYYSRNIPFPVGHSAIKLPQSREQLRKVLLSKNVVLLELNAGTLELFPAFVHDAVQAMEE